jgi:hypothetical protein
MARSDIERIRDCVLNQCYSLTEHAYEEIAEDNLDVLDLESALLTGGIVNEFTHDPRGTRYEIHGYATDQATLVGVVVRFVLKDRLLVITAFEVF